MKINFSGEKPSSTNLIIVPVFQGCELGSRAKALDAVLGGLLTQRMAAKEKFQGNAAQPLRLSVDPAFGAEDIIMLGVGKPENVTEESVRSLSAALKTAINNVGENDITILSDKLDGMPISEEVFAATLIDGYAASIYSFNKYKTNANDNVNQRALTAVVSDPVSAHHIYEPLKVITDSANWARDLGNEPPNMLTPVIYAKRIEDEFRGQKNVSVKTLDEADMADLKMGGILAVSQGSTRNPPRIVVIEYDGTNGAEDRPYALVGKGVTFDTGGYNLKPGGSMANMKTDMCGSAAVVGAMRSLVATKTNARVVAIVGLAENMVDGNAYRPSDVIEMMKGVTVEIGNTDAEGRLVLGDCLTYIQRYFDPHSIINVATLTGAMVTALGDVYTGTFTNDDDLWEKLENAGKQTGELNWRMPVLHEAFTKAVKGDVADLSNTGMMNGAGASTAAAFLYNFIEEAPDGSKRAWAHLDIAGTSRAKGAVTGVGSRMLTQLVMNDASEKVSNRPESVIQQDVVNG